MSLSHTSAPRRRIQLVSLDCALIVAEEGSFLGASRRIRMHHSALSRRIRDLEDSLGVTLFERHSTGVRPTRLGAKLLRNLSRVLSDLDDTLAIAQPNRKAQAVGNLTSGPDALMQVTEFLDVVVDFIRERPDVELRLVKAKRGPEQSR
ncbi:LysR family transcriptional regulator [Mesorhizobium sp. ESP6-5]|uniref:LysR family transcriptional regulator n=1 Tax=unclassified Mesorhizobium TaxID=325217 RepID=UPI00112BBA52|nr:LysR family transcriptional regulator [Mesorhizobium sp. B2-5-9]MBZ9756975.1 LysR family transcriptional regulator [Mesorhizobium sp. ESP6-5]TPK23972.1 LysR family transcriptional regulator [Mesorhizobium sp. B2-5-9]TPK23999.1 LysR family transcriptional regulator [Mesorhizobium sp. B2-5-9]